MTSAISISKFRSQLGQIINEVTYHKKVYILTKHGKPIAKLIPVDPTEEDTIKPNDPQFKKDLKEFIERYDSALRKLANS